MIQKKHITSRQKFTCPVWAPMSKPLSSLSLERDRAEVSRQLGGYARHRHAFKMNHWQGLIDEVSLPESYRVKSED